MAENAMTSEGVRMAENAMSSEGVRMAENAMSSEGVCAADNGIAAVVLQDRAGALLDFVDVIRICTDEMAVEISRLSSCWEGAAAETFIHKLDILHIAPVGLLQIVRDYAGFLQKAADDCSRGKVSGLWK